MVESNVVRLGLLKQKLENCKTWKEKLHRCSDTTRVIWHDSCPTDCGNFENGFLYYLSNSNNSKCNKLIYDEKWVVQKLKIFGNSQGYFGHFDDLYGIVFVENK